MDVFAESLRAKGLLSEAAARRLAELETRAHVPVARELHALLYLGALLILLGVGATVKDRLDALGPLTIPVALSLAATACFLYCGQASRPFELTRVESPTAAFDYVLYLGCGLAGILVSYLEWKWHFLGDWWDLWLFFSGLACVGLAYRFDNRLVLNTGLLNLAGWLGVRFHHWEIAELGARVAVFVYGSILLGLSVVSRRGGVKAHFEDAYLRLGANLALLALAYDAWRLDRPGLWILLLACAALGAWSARARRFETFAYAVVYAYVCLLAALLREVHGFEATLRMLVGSSAAVLAALLWTRARFREAA